MITSLYYLQAFQSTNANGSGRAWDAASNLVCTDHKVLLVRDPARLARFADQHLPRQRKGEAFPSAFPLTTVK